VNPAFYMFGTYHHLVTALHPHNVAILCIDKYLNAGITGDPKHPRALRASAEKDALLDAVAHELKVAKAPVSFTIDGQAIQRGHIQRVFSGKGSPSQIRTAMWLATRVKRTTPEGVDDYCDKFVGLDCNGFVGNFWGGDGNTEIDFYDKGRRTDPAKITTGDALVFYNRGAGTPFHIAVVEEARLSADQKKVSVRAVQSAGLEKGLELVDWGEQTLERDVHKSLFYTRHAGSQIVFFAEGPPKGTPNV